MKKSFESVLYSTVGVGALLLTLVGANFLAGRVRQRVDMTAEHVYTLSPGTKAILSKLDTPIQIRFYSTRGEGMPVFMKNYAQRVDDLLSEYKQAAKGNIEIQKLDPEPDSDAEDSAKLDGVEGQMLPNGEKIYMGLSVSMLDQKEAVPFLSPERERLMEYDISRAISRVQNSKKPVIGVMSPLPVNGQQMNPMMMQMGQRGQQPWVLMNELKRDFNVKTVEMTADSIPDDVKVLLLIHPRNITDAAQYAIDQFVLRGGKLIAFLDSNAVLDRQQGMMMGGGSSSNIEKLLKAWGVSYDATKVVADMNYMGRTQQGDAPAVLALNEKAVNKDDVVTADADNLFMIFSGAFSGTPAAGLKETVLIKSSKDSQLVDPMTAQMSPDKVSSNFSASGIEYPLAIRLTGKFKTAFPDGKPGDTAKADDKNKNKDKKAPAGLKESAQDNSVVLIGDSDMIQDQIAVREMQNPFGGGRMVMPANSNLAFAQGVVEQMTGDDNLIAVRSRASVERPFTVVRQMQADAEAAYRNKIKDLEASLADTQSKLNELQQTKQENGQKYILSPEQQTELANFRKKEGEVKKQLKEVRRNLARDIDSLENRIKWIDIAGMPALVAASGVGIGLLKRKRAAAK
jgi:ABC-type uncharacterized transport system involved in gliding motility auxiliary subunit